MGSSPKPQDPPPPVPVPTTASATAGANQTVDDIRRQRRSYLDSFVAPQAPASTTGGATSYLG